MARPRGQIRKKDCKQCGKEFVCPYRFNIGRWVKVMYCSRKCSSMSQRTREKKLCVMCEKEFETTYQKIVCCSNECRYKRNSTIRGKDHANYNRIKKSCVVCSKEMLVIPVRAKVQKTCSKKCYRKSLKGKIISMETRRKLSLAMMGDNAPNWKGGITADNKKIRGSLDYKIWRVAVFIRDDYTCQMCKEKGGTLNADHIKPFAHYPELRFAIDNGRTLCVDCHKTTDTYGFRANNYKFMTN